MAHASGLDMLVTVTHGGAWDAELRPRSVEDLIAHAQNDVRLSRDFYIQLASYINSI